MQEWYGQGKDDEEEPQQDTDTDTDTDHEPQQDQNQNTDHDKEDHEPRPKRVKRARDGAPEELRQLIDNLERTLQSSVESLKVAQTALEATGLRLEGGKWVEQAASIEKVLGVKPEQTATIMCSIHQHLCKILGPDAAKQVAADGMTISLKDVERMLNIHIEKQEQKEDKEKEDKEQDKEKEDKEQDKEKEKEDKEQE
jgi:hypothetical protein